MTTNYDLVKGFSLEETARFVSKLAGCPLNVFTECPLGNCVKNCRASDCWLAWLKSPKDERVYQWLKISPHN